VTKKKFVLLLLFLLAVFSRFYRLDTYPSGFYSDESLYGYEAYSLLNTGKDEYGQNFPIFFKAFGDFRPGLYIYSSVPFIQLFGLNEFSTRLPSALMSVTTAIVVYLLAKELFGKWKISTISTFIYIISPWNLQFARMSHETNLATLLVVIAILLFIKGLKKGNLFHLSLTLFSLSLYSYYDTRVFVPLFLPFLLLNFRSKILKQKTHIIRAVFIFFLILLPLFILLSRNNSGWSRVSEISFWGDKGILADIIKYRSEDGITSNRVGVIYHNKFIDSSISFIHNFLVHFDHSFLFTKGDPVNIYNTPNVGIIYIAEAIFAVVGFYHLIRTKNGYLFIITAWLVIGILPDALTRLTPSSARIHLTMPLISLLAGYGSYQMLIYFVSKSRPYLLIPGFLVLFLILQFGYYIHQYYFHLPIEYAAQWHYGLREVYKQVALRQNNYHKIWLSKNVWGWINLLFYLKYDPGKIQQQIVLSEVNEYGLGWVYGFDKYIFDDFPKNMKDKTNILFVGTPQDFQYIRHPLATVYYPNGDRAFYITDNKSL